MPSHYRDNDMAMRVEKANKKKKKKINPSYLGTGMLRKAAEALRKKK